MLLSAEIMKQYINFADFAPTLRILPQRCRLPEGVH
jgi:hypothetical protein